MVDKIEIGSNRLLITKNDKAVFDSDAKSVQLFAESTKIVKSNFQIDFPDMYQGNAYHRYSGGQLGSLTYCESWATLFMQEWGYYDVDKYEQAGPTSAVSVAGPSTRNIPQILLGNVPAQTDYLDVRVRLSRTVVPAVMWGLSAPYVLFQEGEWINLVGGSCPTEEFQPMLFRNFEIVREGTAVYLRRYQSVKNKGTYDSVMPSGGTIISTDSNVSGGWTVGHEGQSWPVFPGAGAYPPIKGAWLSTLIDVRGPNNNGGKRRFGTSPGTDNQCYIPGKSIGYPSLRSVYTGDIIIHPGRYE